MQIIEGLKKILNKNEFAKIVSLTGGSTLVKIAVSVITGKIIAVQLGPAGVAVLSYLNDFISYIQQISVLGSTNALIKYLAEFKEEQNKKKVISTLFFLYSIISLFISILLLLFCKALTMYIFNDIQYMYVVILSAFALPFMAYSYSIISVLNGLKLYKRLVISQIVTSLFNLVLTVVLIVQFGLSGALISYIVVQSFSVIITWFFTKEELKLYSPTFRSFDKSFIRKILPFVLMGLVPPLFIKQASILIRKMIETNFSIAQAGMWDGANKLSFVYLFVAQASFAMYFLPRFSELKTSISLRKELKNTYKIVFPLSLAGLLIVFILKDFLVDLFLDKSFEETKNMMGWQLIGDFFKILSLGFSFLLVAKSRTTSFIIGEISYAVIYFFSVYLLIPHFGIKASVMGYAIAFLSYFLIELFFCIPLLKKSSNGY